MRPDVITEYLREGEGGQVGRQLGLNRRVGGGMRAAPCDSSRPPVGSPRRLPLGRQAACHQRCSPSASRTASVAGIPFGVFIQLVGVRLEGPRRCPLADDLEGGDPVERRASFAVRQATLTSVMTPVGGAGELLGSDDPQLGEVAFEVASAFGVSQRSWKTLRPAKAAGSRISNVSLYEGVLFAFDSARRRR